MKKHIKTKLMYTTSCGPEATWFHPRKGYIIASFGLTRRYHHLCDRFTTYKITFYYKADYEEVH